MTREEAIKTIAGLVGTLEFTPTQEEAFEMAIEALRREEADENSNAKTQNSNKETQKSNGETIKWLESLKAEIGKSEHRALWHYAEAIDMAIEAVSAEVVSREEYDKVNDLYLMSIKAMMNKPVIVRCKDCRYCTEYYDRDGYPYWECAEWDGGTDADGFCHYGERKKKINEK